jgi:acetamidase/formamidase
MTTPRRVPGIPPLTREHGIPALDACLLCSVCGERRVSEIVDVPNSTVSFYFPRVVLE